ncbi:DUF2303 family protein [Metapseudomonas resinovorans]|uniref:DUF2303 family protein n=1 Tax=Metapseudomonas resinovorans TaxID=53412 RepID=UPI00040AA15C|nr:DUF2303 family protein [Pseudomonas resinovorans]
MLQKDTLQLILANALAAAGQQITIADGATLAVLPEAVKLNNLEPFQPGRNRFRGALTTHSITDFTKYVAAHTSDVQRPAGFVDQDQMSATIIFNLGDDEVPGHGDDSATLSLKQTAAYAGLLAILGRGLSQQALAEWLEDWMPHLVASTGNESLGMPAAINAVRRMTIKAASQRDSVVGDLSSSRSAMDEIEARSLDTLPTTFVFTTAPFDGLSAASITLRLSVITGRDEPLLKLRWVGEEAQREEFAKEFKDVLEQQVGGLVPLTIGTFNLGK